MEYSLQYDGVMEQCAMLSQFEGRDYHAENGDSLYLAVKITSQDEPLVRGYMEQGARKLEDMMERMVVESAYGDGGFRWELRTDETRWNAGKEFDGNMRDALKCYAMAKWLDGRKSDRVEAYNTLFAELSEMCRKGLMRKTPPRRREKKAEYTNTVTMEAK